MDYTELSQAIQDYCENTESSFVANIPTFVQLAEQRIYNSVQVLAERKNSTGLMTQNNPYLSLPSDWLATYSLSIVDPETNTRAFLLNKDVEYIREAFPDPTAQGVPTHYAQFDKDTMIIGPTPNYNYSIELHYFGYPQSIVTANTTWLGNNFDNVLLYGSLREAYLYMKGEPDMITNYEQKYQEGLVLLKTLAEGKNRTDTYRVVQNRVPVR